MIRKRLEVDRSLRVQIPDNCVLFTIVGHMGCTEHNLQRLWFSCIAQAIFHGEQWPTSL